MVPGLSPALLRFRQRGCRLTRIGQALGLTAPSAAGSPRAASGPSTTRKLSGKRK